MSWAVPTRDDKTKIFSLQNNNWSGVGGGDLARLGNNDLGKNLARKLLVEH